MAVASGVSALARQTEIAISRADRRAALAAFSAPTLVINGAHDPICTPAHHRLAACQQRETFNDCGHFVPLEDPRRLAQCLHRWITERVQ